jgi:hypothetical protein
MAALHLLFKLKAQSLKSKTNAGAVRRYALKKYIQHGFVKTLCKGIAI